MKITYPNPYIIFLNMKKLKIGIIGSLELSDLNFINKPKTLIIETKYGKTSSQIVSGEFENSEIFFIARYDFSNKLTICKVNFKANLLALKELNCDYLFTFYSCSSLQEEIFPGEFIVFNQFIDFSNNYDLLIDEKYTGEIYKLPMTKPFDETLTRIITDVCIANGITIHTKGVAISTLMQRSLTRLEANFYRQMGGDVVCNGLSQEIILANELNIPIASFALCTHYDSWRTDILPFTNLEKENIYVSEKYKLIKILNGILLKLQNINKNI